MDKHKILVLDGRSLATLAIIRSLGKKGYEVHCGESFKNNLSFYSKYVRKKIIYPSPEDRPEEFIDKICKVAEEERYDLIIPVRDQATLCLAKHRKRIDQYTDIYLAEFEKIQRLNDKGETVKLAQAADVPVPQTFFPEELDKKNIKTEVDYPILVRPRIGSGARGIEYVANPSDFDEAYSKVEKNYGKPIVQEYISHKGGHYSIGTLFDRSSKEIATHVYLETKQYPINGGPAVTARSVKIPEWAEKMLNLFEELNWIGPAHMDILYDLDDETPKLLEVNPRFWMSINVAIQAGVDFPDLLCRLSLGEELDTENHYKDGLKYRWVVPNELLWLLNTPNKIEGLKEFINFWEDGVCYGTLSRKDPFPVLGAIGQGLNFFFEKEKRKQIFDRGW